MLSFSLILKINTERIEKKFMFTTKLNIWYAWLVQMAESREESIRFNSLLFLVNIILNLLLPLMYFLLLQFIQTLIINLAAAVIKIKPAVAKAIILTC